MLIADGMKLIGLPESKYPIFGLRLYGMRCMDEPMKNT